MCFILKTMILGNLWSSFQNVGVYAPNGIYVILRIRTDKEASDLCKPMQESVRMWAAKLGVQR